MSNAIGRFSPPVAFLLLLSLFHSAAGEPVAALPLPEPLTLEHALSLADTAHPDLEYAGAALDAARAGQQSAASRYGVRVGMELALRAVDPSPIGRAVHPSNNDSWAKLKASKRLYDFGATRAAEDAAAAELRGREWGFLDARQQRRLEIMTRYFDVLLADLEYARDSEALATDYVEYDRLRQRNELGQVSDIEMLEAETRYQAALRQRKVSEAQQRAARSRLAIALNRPGELSASLELPQLSALARSPDELEPLVREALDQNPLLQQLRADVRAAEERVREAESRYNGEIRGELEAAAYNREFARDNPLTAALVLEVPFVTGGVQAAEVAEQRALVREKRARLAQEELEVQQAVLDLWLELSTLQVASQELDTLDQYRDLYLDRSRALYELEVAADLGDAMVGTSDYRLRRARNDFTIALAWARLDALTGRLLEPPGTPAPVKADSAPLEEQP